MEGIPGKTVRAKGDRFNVLFVGWIARAKGALTIFEVAKRLPKIKATLIGVPTKEIGDLFKADYNNIDNIEMTGKLTKPELIQHLLKADVFIFPSFSEGFPCSVTEAMAYSLPVLAAPVGAIPDMIENGKGGYLIESQDIDGYVKAVLRLMEDDNLRESMGTYNKIKANREYDYTVVIKKLCNLYDSVLENSSKIYHKQ
jgi:glycosyltransferase involved in cell wall biosynthesis